MTARRPSGRVSSGRFIVVEGIDGAGTTTQVRALRDALAARGVEVVATREPSDGPIGTMVRQALTGRLTLGTDGQPLTRATLALLFAADRLDHLAALVEPALARGAWVLSDRYLLSSLAYQGLDLPLDWVEALNARARRPDLTLFIDIAPRAASARRASRGGSEELFEAEALQAKIARRYRALVRSLGRRERVAVLDGARPVEEVTAQGLAAMDRFERRR